MTFVVFSLLNSAFTSNINLNYQVKPALHVVKQAVTVTVPSWKQNTKISTLCRVCLSCELFVKIFVLNLGHFSPQTQSTVAVLTLAAYESFYCNSASAV